MSKSNFLVRGGADFSGINKEMQKLQSNMQGSMKKIQSSTTDFQSKISSTMGKVGAVFASLAIGSYIKSSVAELSNMQSEIVGLNSVARGMGRSFAQAQKFIDEFTSDGLIPATDAITAYKNLLSRGYDDKQIQSAMTRLKDSAAFGRRSSLSYGESIRSATEGLKNENSLLVDNVGVTKNVAKMWDDYAHSIGTTANKLTKQQKIQAEVTGIMEETKFQIGDATRYAKTYAGETAKLSKNFLDLKIAVGGIFMPIAQVVIPYISAAVSWVTKLAQAIGNLVQTVTGKGGFGVMVTDTASVSDSLGDIGGSAIEAGNDVAEGAKKAKGALAGFDEITVLQQGNAGSNAGAVADVQAPTTGMAILDTENEPPTDNFEPLTRSAQKFMDVITPTTEAIKNLWDTLGLVKEFAFTGLKDFYNEFLVPVGNWVFGEGLPEFFRITADAVKNINWDQLNASLANLWTALTPFAISIGQGLLDFYNLVLVPIGSWVMNEALPQFLDSIIKGVASIDFGNIIESFKCLWEAITPFGEKIGEGLLWLWENVLVPMGTWTINEVLPLFLDGLASAFEILSATIDAFKEPAQWLFDNFLLPISKWTGGVIVDVLGEIVRGLEGFSDWANAHKDAIQAISVVIGAFFLALKRDVIVQGAMTLATTAWNTAAGIGAIATSAFGAAVAFLTSPITLAILAIGALIAIVILLVNNWDTVKEVAASVWEKIKEVWSVAASWLDENVIQPIASFFSMLMEGIGDGLDTLKSTFTSIFNSLVEIAKKPINAIIGIVNGMISGVITGVNSIIMAVNTLHFELPDWIPELGGKSFGFNISMLTAPSVPFLAKGGIISQPTLAMVGEQGREAVMPLENNTGWITDLANQLSAVMSMNSGGNTGSNAPSIINLHIDGRKFAEATIDDLRSVAIRRGITLIPTNG